MIKSPLGLIRFAYGFISSFIQSYRFYGKIGADALVGFGGFSSFGPAMAAIARGIPVLSTEANRAVGKAVRFLAKHSTRVYLPEGMLLEGISPEVIRNLGYPLEESFEESQKERARKQLGVSLGDRLLVVLGGSQGAVSLNTWVKNNLENLAAEGLATYCLTGMQNQSSGVIQLEGLGE